MDVKNRDKRREKAFLQLYIYKKRNLNVLNLGFEIVRALDNRLVDRLYIIEQNVARI